MVFVFLKFCFVFTRVVFKFIYHILFFFWFWHFVRAQLWPIQAQWYPKPNGVPHDLAQKANRLGPKACFFHFVSAGFHVQALPSGLFLASFPRGSPTISSSPFSSAGRYPSAPSQSMVSLVSPTSCKLSPCHPMPALPRVALMNCHAWLPWQDPHDEVARELSYCLRCKLQLATCLVAGLFPFSLNTPMPRPYTSYKSRKKGTAPCTSIAWTHYRHCRASRLQRQASRNVGFSPLVCMATLRTQAFRFSPACPSPFRILDGSCWTSPHQQW